MQRLLHFLNRLPLPLQRLFRALRGPQSPIFKLYLLASGARSRPIPLPPNSRMRRFGSTSHR